MTKRKAYQEENGSDLQTQRAIDNVYINALEENIPASRESSNQNTLYEPLDLSSMQTTTKSPGQVSNENTIRLPVAAVRSIRCLEVVCAVLVVIIIAMAATIGSLMYEQNKRLGSIEGKADLLHSGIDHIQAENNTVVIKNLGFKITQMESDFQNIFRNYEMRTKELETKSNNYSETVQEQGIRISALEVSSSHRAAFTVNTPADKNSSSIMRFSRIITNIGGGYNTTSGQFTCSVPGLYFFALSLLKERTSTRKYDIVSCYIRRNGIDLVQAYLDPTDDDTDKGGAEVSAFIIVSLSSGDIIEVGGCRHKAAAYNSRSSFSGFLFLVI